MRPLLLAVVILSFFNDACRKNKSDLQTELAKLPPESQSGAETFGCLVNGKAFLPKGPSLLPILLSHYDYIYPDSPQGYAFQVSASDKSHGDNRFSVVLLIDSVALNAPQTSSLSSGRGRGTGMYHSALFDYPNWKTDDFSTTNSSGGQVYIKKFDSASQVVSGTFWFNAINDRGDTVKITDGRFDTHYTR